MVVWPRSKPHAVEGEAQPLGLGTGSSTRVARINLAGNQLPSRAALVGGRAPPWDTNQAPLQGYFEAVYDIRNAGQPPVSE